MRLRVGTYNLAIGKTDRGNVPRLDRIVSKIHSLRCDLFGLQEMRRHLPEDPARDLVEHLTQLTKAAYPYACEGVTLREKSRSNMVLSRFEILQHHSFLISDLRPYGGTRDTEPRHLLVTLVQLAENARMYFSTTHLHTRRKREDAAAADERKRQCERILGILRDLPNADSTPVLLVGDFNNNRYLERSDPEPEIDLLLTEFNDLSRDSGDTRRRKDGTTGRLDRVFGNRFVESLDTHPDQDPVGTDEMYLNEAGLPLSDHCAVVVTVNVKG